MAKIMQFVLTLSRGIWQRLAIPSSINDVIRLVAEPEAYDRG